MLHRVTSKRQHNFKDLSGKKFGNLVAQFPIDFARAGSATTKKSHTRWRCLCACGRTADVLSTHLLRKNTRSCGCSMYNTGKSHKQWTGYGEISGSVWNSIVRNKNNRGEKRASLGFNITIKYVWELYVKQNKKCALSGVDIFFPIKSKSKGTASLDRIDPRVGYIKGNVQWVHKDINMLKCTFAQEYFITMCKNVAKHVSAGGVCELP